MLNDHWNAYTKELKNLVLANAQAGTTVVVDTVFFGKLRINQGNPQLMEVVEEAGADKLQDEGAVKPRMVVLDLDQICARLNLFREQFEGSIS
jgi:hypothetical protein